MLLILCALLMSSHSSVYPGSSYQLIMEPAEQNERRRSSRIIALEETREKGKERQEPKRKNESINPGNCNKGKENVSHDFISYYDEQHSPSKKKGKECITLHQLFPSTQEGQQFLKSASTSSSTNRDDCYIVERQTRDFAMPRGKLQQNMQASIEQYKLNKNVVDCYNHCLKRYRAELGPEAQNIASKRLNDLKFSQVSTSNLANVVDIRMRQPTPQRDAANSQEAERFQQLVNRGTLIPDLNTPALEMEMDETIGGSPKPEALKVQQLPSTDAATTLKSLQLPNVGNPAPNLISNNVSGTQPAPHASTQLGISIKENASQEKRVHEEHKDQCSCFTCILRKSCNRRENEPNQQGAMNIRCPIKGKMVAPNGNASSFLQGSSSQPGANNQNEVFHIGGCTQINTSALLKSFLKQDKHVPSKLASTSKDGASSSSHMQHVLPIVSGPSQGSSFSRWANSEKLLNGVNSGSTSNKGADLHGLFNPIIKNISYQPHGMVLNQAALDSSAPNLTYTNLPMQLGVMNPVGPLPMRKPNSPLALAEDHSSTNQMENVERRNAEQAQEVEENADEELDLELKL